MALAPDDGIGARVVFKEICYDLLFAVVCPGPNFAEFQKTRAGGPLGKFDIARLHGHFKRRGLQQNVLLGCNFKKILLRT